MSEMYSLGGSFPIAEGKDEDIFECLEQFFDERELVVENLNCSIEDGEAHIAFNGEMSYSEVDDAEAAVKLFAEKYATAPVTFITEYAGAPNKLFVGPPGVDYDSMFFADQGAQIAALINNRRKPGNFPKPPFVMSMYAKKEHLDADRRSYSAAASTEDIQKKAALLALRHFNAMQKDSMVNMAIPSDELEFLIDGLADGSIRIVGGL